MTGVLEVPLDGSPYGLTVGPDKAAWVTLVHAGAIARLDGDGSTRIHPVADGSRPSQLVTGPDGALWFTRNGDDQIGRLTTTGESAAFALPSGSAPYGLCVGPDGALWFTTMGLDGIGRITLDGTVTLDVVATGSPAMITTGPDGALWFTLNAANAIGRLEPATGVVTVREVPTRSGGPVGIAATHDDAVWFTEVLADKLGRIPMDDAIQELDMPGKPHAIVPDPVGGVWVSLWGSSQVARVGADGDVVTIDLPADSEPHGLAVADDGALWVAMEAGFVTRFPL